LVGLRDGVELHRAVAVGASLGDHVLAERPADAASGVVGTMKPALATMRCRNGQIAGQSWGVASLIGMARSIRPWEGGLSGPRRSHISREAMHHGAEIALLRDLYRATGAETRDSRLLPQA
jgi:hypothetical protein